MPLRVDDGLSELRQLEALFPPAVTITRTSQDDFGSRQLLLDRRQDSRDAALGGFRHV